MKFPAKTLAMRADSDVRIRVLEIDTSCHTSDTMRKKYMHEGMIGKEKIASLFSG